MVDADRSRGRAADLPVGTEIGPYRIVSVLGRGGMAVVYEAVDRRLERRVAFKVLAEPLAENVEFRTRFEREARFAASLDHPNIVPIYDAGSVDGLLYIAMRYVPGGTVAALLERVGSLNPEQTLAVVGPVAAALDAAHRAGLVHRDVKPANILLSAAAADQLGQEQVYLGDFGLTRHARTTTGLTVTGTFLGTTAYIAPEQIRGEAVDSRADLYALGCVAFECLIGTPPFVRDDPVSQLWAHLNDDPPAVSDRHHEWAGADAVLARALAKDPSERYRLCSQFVSALSDALLTVRPGVSQTRTAVGARPDPTSPGAAVSEHSHVGRRTVSVFLVDDHELVRRGVAELLREDSSLTVIGEASSVGEALVRIPAVRPDVAVLDLRLPDGNGIELCRELRSLLPELRCLMLTSFTDDEAMLDAVLAGASGYVIKDIKGVDLAASVRAAATGGSLLDARAAAVLKDRLQAGRPASDPLARLSEREMAVAELIGEGLTNREIGQRLSLSETVVKSAVSGVLARLGVHRRAQAAALVTKLREHDDRPR